MIWLFALAFVVLATNNANGFTCDPWDCGDDFSWGGYGTCCKDGGHGTCSDGGVPGCSYSCDRDCGGNPECLFGDINSGTKVCGCQGSCPYTASCSNSNSDPTCGVRYSSGDNWCECAYSVSSGKYCIKPTTKDCGTDNPSPTCKNGDFYDDCTCTKKCDGVDPWSTGCKSCSCPKTTDCTASGCCTSKCSSSSGCSTAAGTCSDVCTTVTLKTGGSCGGCGANGATGACSYSSTKACDATTYCTPASCGGNSGFCTNWTGTTWDTAAPTYEWRASNKCGTETCAQLDVCGIYDSNGDGASENYTFVNYLNPTCDKTCGVDGTGNPNCLNCCETTNKNIESQTCDPSVACSKKTCNGASYYCQYDSALAKWTWKSTTSQGTPCEGTTAVGCVDASEKGSTIQVNVGTKLKPNWVNAPIEEGGGGCAQFRCNSNQECAQTSAVLDACSGSSCSGTGASKSCTCSGSDCTLGYSRCDAAGNCVAQASMVKTDGCAACNGKDYTCKNDILTIGGTDYYPGLLYSLNCGGSCPDCTTQPSLCDDGNSCTVDSCDGVTKTCLNTPVTDGNSCEGISGTCCSGACDSDGLFGTGYDAECRSGPKCLGSGSYGYDIANIGGTCNTCGTCQSDGSCDEPPVCGCVPGTEESCNNGCGKKTCQADSTWGTCDQVQADGSDCPDGGSSPAKCCGGVCDTNGLTGESYDARCRASAACLGAGDYGYAAKSGTCASVGDCPDTCNNGQCQPDDCAQEIVTFSGLNCPTLLGSDEGKATVKYFEDNEVVCDGASVSGAVENGGIEIPSTVSCNAQTKLWEISFDSSKNGSYEIGFYATEESGAQPVTCTSKRILVETEAAPDFSLVLLPALAILALLFARKRASKA